MTAPKTRACGQNETPSPQGYDVNCRDKNILGEFLKILNSSLKMTAWQTVSMTSPCLLSISEDKFPL